MYSDPPALVAPFVYLGSLESLNHDSASVIAHILSLVPLNPKHPLPKSIHHHLLLDNVQDTLDQDLLQHFDTCIAFIRSAVERQQPVLVHCAAGVSRSAAIVAAYLMAYEGCTLAEALEAMRRVRPAVGPNPGFMFQLRVLESLLKTKSQPPFVHDRHMLVQFSRSLLVSQSLHPGSTLWPTPSVSFPPSLPLLHESESTASCTHCRRPVFTSLHSTAPRLLRTLTGHLPTCSLLSSASSSTMAILPPAWIRELTHPDGQASAMVKLSCPWSVNGPMYLRASATTKGIRPCSSTHGQLGGIWWTWKSCPGCQIDVVPPLAVVRSAAVYWQQ